MAVLLLQALDRSQDSFRDHSYLLIWRTWARRSHTATGHAATARLRPSTSTFVRSHLDRARLREQGIVLGAGGADVTRFSRVARESGFTAGSHPLENTVMAKLQGSFDVSLITRNEGVRGSSPRVGSSIHQGLRRSGSSQGGVRQRPCVKLGRLSPWQPQSLRRCQMPSAS